MEREELFRKYLDGELTPEEEKEALHLIADDPEMRSLLRFEYDLKSIYRGGLGTGSSYSVPSEFTDKVMNRIEAVQVSPQSKESLSEKIIEWLEKFWTPREFVLRPIHAIAVIILLIISVSLPVYLGEVQNTVTTTDTADIRTDRSIQQVSESEGRVWLRFVYIDEQADSMAVAGDFSNWEPIPLTKQIINGKQVWTGLVSMNRGEHHYMFLKNGQNWITDPLAPVQREDGFGNKNAVIYI